MQDAYWISADPHSGKPRVDTRRYRKVITSGPKPRKPRKAAPVVDTVKPHPMAWEAALVLADGDPSRLTVSRDGRVVIHNRPQRRRMDDG